MAKLTKEELKTKISEKIGDDDLSIELLEDIEDSFSDAPAEEDTKKIEDLEAEKDDYKEKYEEIKKKYKERFLSSDVKEDEKEEDSGLKEEEVVDIKEI